MIVQTKHNRAFERFYRHMQNELGQWLFGDDAVLVTAAIADHRDALHASELAIIDGAIDKRAFEFSTGRYCAQQALHALGIDHVPVTRGENREPIWPPSIVGSISHCRDIAGAVVANNRQVKSVGLDIENRRQINPEIVRHVCTEVEIQQLALLNAALRNDNILRIFSLKEAVFKCIYQATGTRLGFKECQVTLDLKNSFIKAVIDSNNIFIRLDELVVNSRMTERHIYSSALWHYLPAVG